MLLLVVLCIVSVIRWVTCRSGVSSFWKRLLPILGLVSGCPGSPSCRCLVVGRLSLFWRSWGLLFFAPLWLSCFRVRWLWWAVAVAFFTMMSLSAVGDLLVLPGPQSPVAVEHPAQTQPPAAAAAGGGDVTPPGKCQNDPSVSGPALFPGGFPGFGFEPGPFLCDRLTVVFPLLCDMGSVPSFGLAYLCSRDGKVETIRDRREMVEGSWSSRVSIEVHGAAPHDVDFLRYAAALGKVPVWLRLDGNPQKWFQPCNVLGSPDVYGLARAFVLSVLERLEVVGSVFWPKVYLNRVDATLNFDLGSFRDASSLVRQLSRFASISHRRASGFDTSLVFPGRASSLSIYHKGPEMRVHKPGWCPPELLEFADRVVRFEVVNRSERLEKLELRRLSAWRSDPVGSLMRCWQSFVSRLRFPQMSTFDLSAIPAAPRRSYGLWLAGHDVGSMVSRKTMYRHRLAIIEAGGPDIALPKPSGDLLEFRRVLVPQVAAVPDFLRGTLYAPPRAA